jgi:hypothetical protein
VRIHGFSQLSALEEGAALLDGVQTIRYSELVILSSKYFTEYAPERIRWIGSEAPPG